MTTISTGYVPRPLQLKLHLELKRFNVLVCHRRFGKSVFGLNEIIDQGLHCNRKNPQYAYVGPSYAQVKRIAWDYLKDYTRNFPGVKTNEQEMRVDIPRSRMVDGVMVHDRVRIMLLSGEKPDSLRGLYLDGILFDEYAEMDPRIWFQIARPALSDRLGWAIFIGTPKGKNHFYDLLEKVKNLSDWYTCVYKASETNLIPNSELADARAIMDPAEYAQEFECDFTAALVGSYYGQQMADARAGNRICRVPYQDFLTTHTFWDLGIDDHTAIWFMQESGKEFHFIDYLEEKDKGLDYYVKELRARGYQYGNHYFPHDMKARELGTGKSREETIIKMGLEAKSVKVLPRQTVEDGIHAVRAAFGRCWFDEDKTRKGIDCLDNYQKKWDSKGKIYISEPLHNWASHGADAFRQFGIGYRDQSRVMSGANLPRQAQNDYDIYSV